MYIWLHRFAAPPLYSNYWPWCLPINRVFWCAIYQKNFLPWKHHWWILHADPSLISWPKMNLLKQNQLSISYSKGLLKINQKSNLKQNKKKAIWLLKPSTFISTLHYLWSHSSFSVILWLCFQSCSSIKYRWKFAKKNCWTYKSQENANALKCWKGITKFVELKCKLLSFHVVFSYYDSVEVHLCKREVKIQDLVSQNQLKHKRNLDFNLLVTA